MPVVLLLEAVCLRCEGHLWCPVDGRLSHDWHGHPQLLHDLLESEGVRIQSPQLLTLKNDGRVVTFVPTLRNRRLVDVFSW